MKELRHIVQNPNDALYLLALSGIGLEPTSFLVDSSNRYLRRERRLDSAPECLEDLPRSWNCILNTHVKENFRSAFANDVRAGA